MSMDLAAFMSASLAPREADLEGPAVAQLAPFFPAGEVPRLRVRALTGAEIYRAAEARHSAELRAAIADALAGGSRQEIADAIREAIGVGESVPAAMAVAISKLVHGSVDPKLDQDQVVRMFKLWPIVAVAAASLIDRLNNQGPDLGNCPGSTPTPPSA